MGNAALKLAELGRTADEWAEELRANGACVIRDLVSPQKVRALYDDLKPRFERTPFCRGSFYGQRTKRFGGLLKRSRHTAAFVMHPLIIKIANLILGPNCDRIQLNLTQALEIHPGELVQPPHRDQGMYWAPAGAAEYLFNVMWPFTPYTKENGATLLFPQSHLPGAGTTLDTRRANPVEMGPGSALIFLGSTLHCAGANRTDRPRTGMLIGYSLGWLMPYENQWLAYPPEIARTFPPELADLIGYRIHRPNLNNYEGQCPSVLLRSEVPEHLPAIDAMGPELTKKAAFFKAQQAALMEVA